MHGLILGINGSPRKDGIGAFLLKQALDAAEKENFFTHLLHLGDYNIPYCDGDYTDKTPTGLEMLFSMIERADGIIFASPVHYFNVSGRMKSLIDHLTVFEFRGESDGYALCGKVAGCIATCEEDGGHQSHKQKEK